MHDLLDIAPSTATEIVKVGGKKIEVRGVSIDAIAYFAARFPELKRLFDGGFGESMIPRLIEGCGAAVGPIIAAGCGHRGEAAYEQHASTLLPEYQVKLLASIFRLTFPNGIGSFVEDLTKAIDGASEGAKGFKVRLRKPPSSPQPSFGEDASPTLMQ